MSYANGRFPDAALADIAGGSRLAVEDYRSPGLPGPAAGWNAMAAHIYRETGQRIMVTGPRSAYRTYGEQEYFWNEYLAGRGALAARPGTSNHGMGINVDVPLYVRQLIDKYGAPFGWSKSWSDAPGEWWHITYQAGHYKGKDPGPGYTGSGSAGYWPTLKRGDKGKAVKRAQRHLRRHNLGITRPSLDGDFGGQTKVAVQQFQKVKGLKPDGVVGKATWAKLRTKRTLTRAEQTAVNRARLLRYGGLKDHERDEYRKLRDWIDRRLDWMHREAEKKGQDWFKRRRRRKRFVILKRTIK